jgi:uncharacterized protein
MSLTTIKTLILGATSKTDRYAYKAAEMLHQKNHPLVLIGNKQGEIFGYPIHHELVNVNDIHTITLYLNKFNQEKYYEYILQISPQRIIFNPGTENETLFELAQKNNIQAIEACTLVMLSIGNY